MSPLRRVLLVCAAFAVLYGVQACATESPGAELNPQPLPPEDEKTSVQNPEEARDPAPSTGGSTSSSGGSSSGSGTIPDASDGGPDSGGDG